MKLEAAATDPPLETNTCIRFEYIGEVDSAELERRSIQGQMHLHRVGLWCLTVFISKTTCMNKT